ncbi:hypothetical protein [Jeotgalibacillus proteolyticus]|uniref:Uncharacterized protein n=1 Tax=Jeotgalibacillus proteolyticus TaxID=2082395 RepID=A0A2S5G7H3_9BACL|nr:hypothetical protein [Jeotgalibacillus proteolyticus]PPA68930.1 hypothetical protein C4B60_18630 [Jeotgalibacillus proteolyticus]
MAVHLDAEKNKTCLLSFSKTYVCFLTHTVTLLFGYPYHYEEKRLHFERSLLASMNLLAALHEKSFSRDILFPDIELCVPNQKSHEKGSSDTFIDHLYQLDRLINGYPFLLPKHKKLYETLFKLILHYYDCTPAGLKS